MIVFKRRLAVRFFSGFSAMFAMLAACSSSSLSGAHDAGHGGVGELAGGIGGAPAGGVGGTGGAPAGGVGGAAASRDGAAGSSYDPSSSVCNPPAPHVCTSTAPPAALISDFSIAPGGSTPDVFGSWGESIIGGTYVYPSVPATPGSCDSPVTYPITQILTGGSWTVSGTVGTYSGMGLWWACNTGTSATPNYIGICLLDASVYSGISFKISGDAGPQGTVALKVGTPSTMKPSLDYAGNPKDCGTCAASTCGSSVSIAVAAIPSMVSFTWAELGVTEANALAMILLMLPDPCDYSTGTCVPHPFPVSVTIDDLTFTN